MKESDNNFPFVSIGLPVYNGEPYLRDAIQSILSQSYPNIELIICDNASTDGTQEICSAIAATQPHVRYHRNQDNMGAAYNYNLTFSLSHGIFFKWASADDLISPLFIESCLEELQKKPNAVLCYPKTTMIDENGKFIEAYADLMDLQDQKVFTRYQKFYQRLKISEKCNAIFGLIRSSSLKKTRLIDHFVNSDTVLLSELVLLGQIVEVGKPLFFRRIHPKMSIKAYKPADRTSWFDPHKKINQRVYVHWRTGIEFLRSIWRIRIPLVKKMGCTFFALGWFFWRKRLLWSEFNSWLYWKFIKMPEPVQNPIRGLRKFIMTAFKK